MNNNDKLPWATPYMVVSKGAFKYDVVYEEISLVLISTNDHHNAERIAAMLNGAYNLGYSAAKLEQELEIRYHHPGHSDDTETSCDVVRW